MHGEGVFGMWAAAQAAGMPQALGSPSRVRLELTRSKKAQRKNSGCRIGEAAAGFVLWRLGLNPQHGGQDKAAATLTDPVQ